MSSAQSATGPPRWLFREGIACRSTRRARSYELRLPYRTFVDSCRRDIHIITRNLADSDPYIGERLRRNRSAAANSICERLPFAVGSTVGHGRDCLPRRRTQLLGDGVTSVEELSLTLGFQGNELLRHIDKKQHVQPIRDLARCRVRAKITIASGRLRFRKLPKITGPRLQRWPNGRKPPNTNNSWSSDVMAEMLSFQSAPSRAAYPFITFNAIVCGQHAGPPP